VAVFALASIVGAQTPGETESAPTGQEPTSEPTPGPDVTTLVRLAVPETLEQPVSSGDEIQVQVFVDDVEHLAGFDFTIGFEPELLEPVIVAGEQLPTSEAGTPVSGEEGVVKTTNLGQFLTSGERQDILCSDARAQGSRALVTCSLLGAPVCAGGPPGVSGSGLLASVYFESKGGGVTTLEVADSHLVLDDIAPPCDLSEEADIQVIPIPHRTSGVSIELAKDSGLSTVMLVAIVGLVVVVAVVIGGAGYLVYRRRQSTGPA